MLVLSINITPQVATYHIRNALGFIIWAPLNLQTVHAQQQPAVHRIGDTSNQLILVAGDGGTQLLADILECVGLCPSCRAAGAACPAGTRARQGDSIIYQVTESVTIAEWYLVPLMRLAFGSLSDCFRRDGYCTRSNWQRPGGNGVFAHPSFHW
jgi:hypothetical protein